MARSSTAPPEAKQRRPKDANDATDVSSLQPDEEQIVSNVLSYFKEESSRDRLLCPLKRVCRRTAQATGLSKSAVVRMLGTSLQTAELESDDAAGLHRLANDAAGLCALRRQILFHCANYGKPPSLRVVCDMIREQCNAACTRAAAVTLLDRLGFRLRRLPGSSARLLLEDSQQAAARVAFLRKLREFRTEGRDVVYLASKQLPQRGSGSGLLLVHAGHLAQLLPLRDMLRAHGPPGVAVSQEDMRCWLVRKLMPFLPKESVVVTFQVPFYKVLVEGGPTPRYWLDGVIEEHGHAVLRPPPQLLDLNPMENVWCTLHEQLGDVGGGAAGLALLAELAQSASLHLALMRTWTQSLADIQEAEDALLECSLEVDSKLETLLLTEKVPGTESGDASDLDTDCDEPEAPPPDPEAPSAELPPTDPAVQNPPQDAAVAPSGVPEPAAVVAQKPADAPPVDAPQTNDSLARLEDFAWIHSHVDPSVWSDVTQLVSEVHEFPRLT